MFQELRGPVKGHSPKLAVLAYSDQFCMLLVTDFGSRCDLNASGTQASSYGELVKTRSFRLFRPVLYAIRHGFWFRLRCERFGNLGVRLWRTRQNSQFSPTPANFVCYYSLILGPVVIRSFQELRGPVTGNSPKLAVLAYSDQFCMLLVTDFGSGCDPNVLGTSGSGYGELVKTPSFGLFRPVFYAISH